MKPTDCITGQQANLLTVLTTLLLCVWPIGSVMAQFPADGLSGPQAHSFLNQHCSDCHAGGAAEGGFEFSSEKLPDWNDSETVTHWEHVHDLVSRRIMPPADATQPDAHARSRFLEWLDLKLKKHGSVGGTVLRRLSRREYQNTIRSVFGFRGFEVSHDFPPDSTVQGFDNHGGSLVTAPGHLEALVTNATAVADRLYPPAQPPVEAQEFQMTGEDLVISYSSAKQVGAAMRLASSGGNYRRNATWPTRFEAPARGVYQIAVRTKAFQTSDDHVPELRLGIMKDNSNVKGNVSQKAVGPDSFVHFEVTLDVGQSFSLLYPNGPFRYDDKKELEEFLTEYLAAHPEIAAAWDHVKEPARGGSGWQQVVEAMQKEDLPVDDYKSGSSKLTKLIKRMSSKNVNTGETLVYHFFEEGPALDIVEINVTGPTEVLPDDSEIQQQRERNAFFTRWRKEAGANAVPDLTQVLLDWLFRREATPIEVDRYVQLLEQETARGVAADEAWHLVIRTALLSPSFLYRSIGERNEISADHLANRLSYFLTSGPPDERLRNVARSGELLKPEVLRREAGRLLSDQFVEDFCDQWLHLSVLDSLMPDARLMPEYSDNHRKAMVEEVHRTFKDLLENDSPVIDLISPDFVLANPILAADIYELKHPVGNKKKNAGKWSRIAVPKDGRHGGLLCMAAVNTATANGVDTQPVLRGVWMLENILGTPPPEPPDAVPALTPDTSAATTVKERLAAHMSESSCAACHREIDPVGFAFENFDPVGRWRSHYPIYETVRQGKKQKTVTKDGLPVDATGQLPDGTQLKNVVDLKRWLTRHPTLFASCLSQKLMTYATGRTLSYREKQVLSATVERLDQDNRLRLKTLLLELIAGRVFLSP